MNNFCLQDEAMKVGEGCLYTKIWKGWALGQAPEVDHDQGRTRSRPSRKLANMFKIEREELLELQNLGLADYLRVVVNTPYVWV